MFDVGFSELVILFVIGLLILGPERLPRVASQLGRWIGKARRTASQLRHQLEREMALNELKNRPLPKVTRTVDPEPAAQEPTEKESAPPGDPVSTPDSAAPERGTTDSVSKP